MDAQFLISQETLNSNGCTISAKVEYQIPKKTIPPKYYLIITDKHVKTEIALEKKSKGTYSAGIITL